MKNITLRTLRPTLYVFVGLFILNQTELVYIKADSVQLGIIIGLGVGALLLLIVETINRSSLLSIAMLLVILIGFVWLNPLTLVFHSGSWKTQTLLLVDEANTRHVVEHQVKDIGALGYDQREVELYYLISGQVFVNMGRYDHRNFIGYKWKKVDQYINEARLREI